MRNETIQLNVWNGQYKPEENKKKGPVLLFKVLCMVVGLCIALALAYLLSIKQIQSINIMPIQHIEIKNELSNKRAIKIYDLLHGIKGQSFISVDLKEAQKSIGQLAWVDSVSLGRQWPNRIYIDIKESVPLAIWNAKNVGLQGNIFEQENKALNLPVFDASENMLPIVINKYIQLQNDFLEMNLYIEKIIVDDRGSVSLELSNATTLMLGSKNIMNKNLRAKKIMATHDTQNKIVDMRYENGFAISETHQR